MIVFLVGEYGAGTPDYSNRPGNKRERLATQPFVSALAQRLLSHPKGGALAVIGHVDVSWMLTFEQFTEAGPSGERRWKSEGNMTFINTVSRLVRGHTVGSAMEFFNTRYTQAAADLVDALLSPTGLSEKQRDLLMLEAVDIRNYIVLGDPAVRVPVEGVVPEQRPVIQVDPKVVVDIDAALQVKTPPPLADLHSPVLVGGERLAKAAPPVPAAPAPGMPAPSADAPSAPAPLAVFNGIDPQTGRYFYPPLAIEEFAKLATGQTADPSQNLDATYKAAGTSYFESSSSSES